MLCQLFRMQCVSALLLLGVAVTGRAADSRNFSEGRLIPKEGYCDQPYIVITRDGNWLCTLTTGPGTESQPGQHVVATISADQGRSWSHLIDIERAGPSESSWVIPAVTPGGRVYAFYDFNGEVVREIPGKKFINSTLMGWYVYRYSDDNGRTWSAKQYRLPLPVAALDRGNEWGGKVQMFWGIDKPAVIDGALMFAFTRLGRYEIRFPRAPAERPANDDWRRLAPTENGSGWVYRSDNILTESDPERIVWKLLPEDGRGIRSDALDPLQQEHNLAALPDGRIACILRTVMGYVAAAYSSDGGRSWTTPEATRYADGRGALKNSIACAMIWRTAAGKYLLWYHNNDDMRRGGGPAVASRNTAWLAAGIVHGGQLEWSQPELVSYNVDPNRGSSYPDLIEDGGRSYISATNKREARVGEVDPELLAGLFAQGTKHEVTKRGLLLEHSAPTAASISHPRPPLPNLAEGGGFSVEVALSATELRPGDVVLDTRESGGAGISIVAGRRQDLEIQLNDGRNTFTWASDPELLQPGRRHHVVFIVDGGPKMVSVVVDGRLCDGGAARAFGYGRFLPKTGAATTTVLADVSGGPNVRLAPALHGTLEVARIYGRALRTSEAIANFRAGSGKK